ncbi:MAG: acylphosphatase [Nevskiales bacterium]|nr:acylphosphatase [Nevskiales bacterium]
MNVSYRFIVRGSVQGVFFRQSTVEQARGLGLTGWVCNRADGSVEGVAQGAPEALEKLRHWLQRGPPQAQVSAVEWVPVEAEPEMKRFVIHR